MGAQQEPGGMLMSALLTDPATEAAFTELGVRSRHRSPMVYVAGPITGVDHGTEAANVARGCLVGATMLDAGITAIVPHLTWYWDAAHRQPYERWIEYALEVVARCDHVFRMIGDSRGADLECDWARSEGIPIFHEGPDATVADFIALVRP